MTSLRWLKVLRADILTFHENYSGKLKQEIRFEPQVGTAEKLLMFI